MTLITVTTAKKLRAIIILLAATFVSGSLVDAGTYEIFTYVDNGTTISITDCDTSVTGTITVPATIDGKPVVEIANSAFQSCRFTAANLPPTITDIGDDAFRGCAYLDSITLPDSVTRIGNDAFRYCSKLGSFTISRYVTSIGTSPLATCKALTSIVVDPENPNYSSENGVLFDKNKTTLIQAPGGLTGIYTLPGTVTSISDLAFSNCSNLDGVSLPSSLTSIGSFSFQYCLKFDSFTIPASVESVGAAPFRRSSMTEIQVDAQNENYTSIDGVLYNKAVTEIIQLPEAFQGHYTLPTTVTSINDHAMENCDGLDSISIPPSVVSIGYLAISDCAKLNCITIPSSVTSIDAKAMSSRTLKSVVFLGDAPTIGESPFNLGTVYIFDEAVGFTTPTWAGLPVVSMGPYSPTPPWLLENGLPHDTDISSDLNGDGVSLLMAYALDLDPNKNLAGSLPKPQLSGGQLELVFHGESEGINYIVEASTNLSTWNTTDVTMSAPNADGTITASTPIDAASKFLKLTVSQ